MVVKYKRQVRSDSIGVIRSDMSVANSLAETANAIGKMSNEAFKIAAVKSEEKGLEYISSKSDSELFGIDEEGKPVNLVDKLIADLPAKGFGMSSSAVIKSEARRRIKEIALQKIETYGTETRAKFPFGANKVRDLMGAFVSDLAAPFGPEYSRLITDIGTKYSSGLVNSVHVASTNNEIKKAGSLLTAETSRDLEFSASVLGGSSMLSVRKAIDAIKNGDDEHHNEIVGRVNNSFNIGQSQITGDSYTEKKISNIAMAKFENKFSKHLKTSEGQTLAYAVNAEISGRGRLDLKSFEGQPPEVKEYAELLEHIDSAGMRGALRQNLQRLIVADNRIDAYSVSQSGAVLTSQSDTIDAESAIMKTNLLNLGIADSKQYNKLSRELSNAIGTNNIPEFIDIISKTKDEIINAQRIPTKEINGKIVAGSKAILTEDQSKKAIGYLNDVAADMIATYSASQFKYVNGTAETTKIKALAAMYRSGGRGAMKMATSLGFTDSQMAVAQLTSNAQIKPVGPANMERDIVAGFAKDFRTAIAVKLEADARRADSLQNVSETQKALSRTVQRISPITSDGERNNYKFFNPTNKEMEAADIYLEGKFGGIDLQKAYFSSEFQGNTEFRAEIDRMLFEKNIIPKSLVDVIDYVSEGKAQPSEVNGIIDFLIKASSPEPDMSGNFDELHRLDDLVGKEKMTLIREAYRASKLIGSNDLSQILRNFSNFKREDRGAQYKTIYSKTFGTAESDDEQVANIDSTIAGFESVGNAGGRGSHFFRVIKDALPFYMYQQVVERGMNPRIKDVENWVDGIVKTNFPKTEDYVLDVFAYGTSSGEYRSPFALARIMPDQEMREAFLEYVERQILKVGEYTLTNSNHDRGELGERDVSLTDALEGSRSFSPGVSLGLAVAGLFYDAPEVIGRYGGDTTEQYRKKIWLAPQYGSAQAPFFNLDAPLNQTQGARNLVFDVVYAEKGEVKYLVDQDENKQPYVVQFSIAEFLDDFYGRMVE